LRPFLVDKAYLDYSPTAKLTITKLVVKSTPAVVTREASDALRKRLDWLDLERGVKECRVSLIIKVCLST
jgi:hypothetical protein